MARGKGDLSKNRRLIVRRVKSLLLNHADDREIMIAVNQERVDAGHEPIPRRSLYRYIEIANRELERDANVDFSKARAIAVATRKSIYRAARTNQKVVFVDGEERKVPEPDLRTALEAQRQLDRLTGVDTEGREAMAACMVWQLATLTEAVNRHVSDAGVRLAIVREMRQATEAKLAELGAADVTALPAGSTIVDQAPSGPSLLPDGAPDADTPPPGTNGTTNGHHPIEEGEEERE